MPLFEIIEIDNDYRAYSGREVKEFPDKAAADAFCRKESWTGYHYYANPLPDHVGSKFPVVEGD